jgi:hypothetical protein
MTARTAVATFVGTLVLTTGVASAAGLSWSSAALGAQSTAVTKCTPTIGSGSQAYVLDAAGRVSAVKVGLAAGACSAGNVTVSLRSESAVVATGTLAVTSCASSVCTVPVPGLPGLETVKAAHVLVTGS